MLPKFIPLADQLRSGPRLIEDFDPTLLKEAEDAGLVKIMDGPEHGQLVHLTGTGLMQILSASQARGGTELIMNLDITIEGLTIKRDLTQEAWLQTLARLKLVHKVYALSLSDLLKYGREHYGNEFVDTNLQQLEFSFDEINRANAIALVGHSTRAAYQLTSEHYYVLGREFPDDPVLQNKWGAAAQEHKLSAVALARSISEDRIITDETIRTQSGRNSGIPVINGFGLTFERWARNAKAEENLERWSPDDKRKLLNELKPILEFAKKVEESL
jgi:hypothetical protein